MSNTSVVLVHVSLWILKLILVLGPTLEGKFGLTAPVSRFLYGPVFSTVVAYHRLYRVSIPRPQTLICTADVIRLSLYPCVLWLFSSAWNLKSHRPVLQYLCSRLGLLVISDVVCVWSCPYCVSTFLKLGYVNKKKHSCPLLSMFFFSRPASSTWSISPGCTTGTPARTPGRPSATSAEKLCQASPPTACPVKVQHIPWPRVTGSNL